MPRQREPNAQALRVMVLRMTVLRTMVLRTMVLRTMVLRMTVLRTMVLRTMVLRTAALALMLLLGAVPSVFAQPDAPSGTENGRSVVRTRRVPAGRSLGKAELTERAYGHGAPTVLLHGVLRRFGDGRLWLEVPLEQGVDRAVLLREHKLLPSQVAGVPEGAYLRPIAIAPDGPTAPMLKRRIGLPVVVSLVQDSGGRWAVSDVRTDSSSRSQGPGTHSSSN